MWTICAILAAMSLTADATPEERALSYLAREAPGWRPANRCASCHHNGDAARALYEAVLLKRTIAPQALENTTDWLSRPERWDNNGGEGPFSDKGLARIQFTSALASAIDSGRIKDHQLLITAADRLAIDQRPDGSWRPDATDALGSPATYGATLGTLSARDALKRADPKRFAEPIARANRWLRQTSARRVLDASAVLKALALDADDEAIKTRNECMEILKQGEANGGGWGPFVNASAPEPFDTAMAVLALSALPHPDDATKGMVQRGRAYLIAAQQEDGSWIETTRPAGSESLAQRLSTSGWATLALLATAP